MFQVNSHLVIQVNSHLYFSGGNQEPQPEDKSHPPLDLLMIMQVIIHMCQPIFRTVLVFWVEKNYLSF